MKLNELIDKLDLRVLSPAEDMEREVRGGYTSDLLSDVMGNAEADTVWIWSARCAGVTPPTC